MLEIVEKIDFKYIQASEAMHWLHNVSLSTTKGFEDWHCKFTLNDGGIVSENAFTVLKAINLLTSELFDEFIREKRNVVRLSNNADKTIIAYHSGIAHGLEMAMRFQYFDHIWILATRIYENMTGIDRGEL